MQNIGGDTNVGVLLQLMSPLKATVGVYIRTAVGALIRAAVGVPTRTAVGVLIRAAVGVLTNWLEK